MIVEVNATTVEGLRALVATLDKLGAGDDWIVATRKTTAAGLFISAGPPMLGPEAEPDGGESDRPGDGETSAAP